jgi:hypothetical protein
MEKIDFIKIPNLKYTNYYLFERREKERVLSEDNKRKNSFNTIVTQSHYRNNNQFPLLSNHQTLTTMNSSINHLSNIKNIKNKKKQEQNIFDTLNIKSSRSRNINSNIYNFNSLNSNNSNSNLYLTETAFRTIQTERPIKPYRIFSADEEKDTKKGEKNKKKKEEKKEKNKLDFNSNFKSNLKLLRYFETYTQDIEEIPSKTQIDFKVNKLKQKKQSIRDIINKTREIILNKYTIDIKNERKIRVKEIIANDFDSIDNVTVSMKKANKLFHENFFQKFSDYVRVLETQREIEKSKNTNLMEQIIKQKNELTQIETLIRKQLSDKNNIVRWIFFQILVKEKKLDLPSYYKSLIEETDENIKKIFSNPQNFSGEETDIRYKYKKQLTKKKFERERDRKSTRKSIINFDKVLTSKPTIVGIYKNISIREARRIRDYKYNLCFSTPEELFERIKKFEYETINYLDEYNKIKIQIQELKKERDEIVKEKEHEIKIETEDIQEKENILNIQKHKNEVLNKEKYNLIEIMKNS